MGNFIAWILLGLLAGGLAKLVMPGDQKGGCLLTMILGIIGASIGGFVGKLIGIGGKADPGSWVPNLGSICTATIGALLLLVILRLITGKK